MNHFDPPLADPTPRTLDAIHESAGSIRFIVSGPDSFEADAFSRAQLIRMLELVREEANAILRATGIREVEDYFAEGLEHWLEEAQISGSVRWIEPYADDHTTAENVAACECQRHRDEIRERDAKIAELES